MESAQCAAWSFFPLDEELGLLPQRYTPRLVAQIVRLGTACTSFAEARALLRDLLGVEVGEETVRRITEAAGRELVAVETAEREELERTLARPPAVLADRLQQVSIDGCNVPLVGGDWAEVKAVAIGTIHRTSDGPKAGALSYFARLGDSERFSREARIEFHRRGTENAREVVAVTDGAEWIPAVLEEHCPGALHIIDWSHAASYIRAAGQALFGQGTADCVAWTQSQLALLWEQPPELVLAELAGMEERSGLEAVRVARQYLEKRREHIHYAAYRAANYPIGSGIIESANKLLVEARLKGAGKHWARPNVDAMLALRCASTNDRWHEREGRWNRRLRRGHRQRPRCARPPTSPPAIAPPPPTPGARYVPAIVGGKPTAAHPWKRGIAAGRSNARS
jgi:hypothetical protein